MNSLSTYFQVYALGGFLVLKWIWARWQERRRDQNEDENDDENDDDKEDEKEPSDDEKSSVDE